MKITFRILTSLALFIFLISCGGGDTPKAVAEKFLNAMNRMDYETAKKYGTEDTGKLLDMMSGFSKMIPDSALKDIAVEIKNEKIDGDKATVTYNQTGEESELTLNLVKVEGKWKVAMTKDTMNEGVDDSLDSGATSTDTSSMHETELPKDSNPN